MKRTKLIHQLFIGKVSEIIGEEKTKKLISECENSIPKKNKNLPSSEGCEFFNSNQCSCTDGFCYYINV